MCKGQRIDGHSHRHTPGSCGELARVGVAWGQQVEQQLRCLFPSLGPLTGRPPGGPACWPGFLRRAWLNRRIWFDVRSV